jgi:hypothetical protein
MMRLFRQARGVALALMLMSPGLGGMAVQALHPCPAQAPMQAAGMHHPASHTHDGPASADPVCHCISSCAATASPASPTDGRTLAVAESRYLGDAALSSSRPVQQLPLDLLPPSTAPPLTPQSLA